MEREDGMVMGQNVILGDREVPVEDLQELSFDPPYITFAEHTSAQRPVNVSESRIIGVLGGYRSSQHETNNGFGIAVHLSGQNKRSQEHTFTCPLLRPDGQVRHRAVNVDERGENDGGFDL